MELDKGSGDEIIVLDGDNKPLVIYRGLRAYVMKDGKLVEILEEGTKKGKKSGKTEDTSN
jgi:pyoverdine/dityrosine biosynthesis protein Dit1